MNSSKLSIKLFFEDQAELTAEQAVPLLHSWIQARALADHLLIDVADYGHVHEGPGVVLVAREANYYLDRRQGRPGLTYTRKAPLPGPFANRLREAMRYALEAAALLEESTGGGARLRTDLIEFRINDRLHAPNHPQTLAAVREDLQGLFGELAGSEVQLEYEPSVQDLFEVSIRAGSSRPVAELLEQLSQQTAV